MHQPIEGKSDRPSGHAAAIARLNESRHLNQRARDLELTDLQAVSARETLDCLFARNTTIAVAMAYRRAIVAAAAALAEDVELVACGSLDEPETRTARAVRGDLRDLVGDTLAHLWGEVDAVDAYVGDAKGSRVA